MDLYMCEVVVVAGRLSCVLKDLTVAVNAGESADVAGADLGTDVTGTYIYFVASGVLAPGASAGSPNLYVQDTSTGETTLVAVLSDGDAPDWRAGSVVSDDFSELTARVSSDGRFVAFMSEESLTGYDNLDANSGLPDEEVFVYDRVSDTLRCVSCNPTDARPRGVFDPGAHSVSQLPLLVDRPGVWSQRWLAGSLPGWPRVDNFHALFMPRNLDDSGRLFFDSADGLVSGDGNGEEDVYEFEPVGVGGCGLVTGCVGLVSSARSGEEAAFLDAGGLGPGGEEGEDVFFMTSAKLVPGDVDTAMDVYDAHECSVAVPCVSGGVTVVPACSTADSCRTAPMSQPEVYGAPASATFAGPGNVVVPALPAVKPRSAAQVRAEELARALKACRGKRNKQRRVACEAQARRSYGAAKKAAVKKAGVRKRARKASFGGGVG